MGNYWNVLVEAEVERCCGEIGQSWESTKDEGFKIAGGQYPVGICILALPYTKGTKASIAYCHS